MQLNSKVSQSDQAKTEAQNLYDELKRKSADLQSQIDQANTERDDWKNRVETITRERDDLMQKLKNRPTQIVYKDRIIQAPPSVAPAAASRRGCDFSPRGSVLGFSA